MNADPSRGFRYDGLPMRVVFGAGMLSDLRAEVEAAGMSRVLVLSTPGQRQLAQRCAALLGELVAGVYSEATMHVPADLVERCLVHADELGVDGCVCVGGGSTIGLGKALARARGIGVVAVATTYSGSEMTPVWGVTEAGVKKTGRDRRVLPRTVVYDPELTMSLPADVACASGLNALAHAVEALYAPDTSPIVSLMAAEGVRALARALPALNRQPADLDARSEALYGAWLCGVCLGATTMSLHHKLCHVLGGSFGLPHAQTHAVVLPYALAYNAPAAPRAIEILRSALGTSSPAAALQQLGTDLRLPRSLEEIGFPRDGVDRAVELVLSNPYTNVRPVTAPGLAALLNDAAIGAPVQEYRTPAIGGWPYGPAAPSRSSPSSPTGRTTRTPRTNHLPGRPDRHLDPADNRASHRQGG